MNIKIKDVKFHLSNPFIKSIENVVSFSYERLSETELNLMMDAFVGYNSGEYRFHLEIDFNVSLDEAMNDVEETFTQIVSELKPVVADLPVILDMFIREDRERH